MRGSSRNGSMDNLSSGPGFPAHGASNGGSQRRSNVYVKNLSEDVDELTLKGVFDKFGAVESRCVIRDVSTNSSRGFGFVKFMQVHQAEAAIKEMNGKVIRGKVLEVKFANSDSSATTAGVGPRRRYPTTSTSKVCPRCGPRWSSARSSRSSGRSSSAAYCTRRAPPPPAR